MSLYHSLETVPIPGITTFRPSPMLEEEDFPRSSLGFAPPSSLNPREEDDLFVRQKETQAQVASSTPVASVPERVYGAGTDTERKRLVYNSEDVDL